MTLRSLASLNTQQYRYTKLYAYIIEFNNHAVRKWVVTLLKFATVNKFKRKHLSATTM